MTPEEQEVEQMLLAASKGAVVDKLKSPALPHAPGEVGSFVRGVGNSALMGYQPQVAGAISTINPWSNQNYSEARNEAADLNEAAWQAHPGYYGTGTALGTAASLLVPGAVLKGIRLAGEAVMAGRGAKAAEAIQAARAGSWKSNFRFSRSATVRVVPAAICRRLAARATIPAARARAECANRLSDFREPIQSDGPEGPNMSSRR